MHPLIIGLGIAAAFIVMSCSKDKESEKKEPECRYSRSNVAPEVRQKSIDAMDEYRAKFGYNYTVYRFNPLATGDLNGNSTDDWLIIRSVKGGQSYDVDSTVVLDMPEAEFNHSNLDELVKRYFLEVPDLPSRTSRDTVTNDAGRTETVDSASLMGNVLLAPVTMIRNAGPDGSTELNFPLNNLKSSIVFITPEGNSSCSSKVIFDFVVSPRKEGSVEFLKRTNNSRPHLPMIPYPRTQEAPVQ